jgi:hypothetical protein
VQRGRRVLDLRLAASVVVSSGRAPGTIPVAPLHPIRCFYSWCKGAPPHRSCGGQRGRGLNRWARRWQGSMRHWSSKSRAAPPLHLQSVLMLLGYPLAGEGAVACGFQIRDMVRQSSSAPARRGWSASTSKPSSVPPAPSTMSLCLPVILA